MQFDSYSSPGALLAEALVNTYDVVRGTDRLPDAPSLARWLDGMRLTQVAGAGAGDLARVVSLRTRLRTVFTGSERDEAVAALNAILAECDATPRMVSHGRQDLHLHVTGPEMSVVDRLGADAAMGLLAVIRESGMERLRTCAGQRCEAVFVDVSRNKSRRFCSSTVCANRAHAATFRLKNRKRVV